MEKAIKGPRIQTRKYDFRWGIGARLGVAFVSVAALALAANLLAEHAMSVVHTTRVVRVVALPRSPVPAIVTPYAPATLAASQVAPVGPEALIATIERYESAVRAHVLVRNAVSDAQLVSAANDLEEATQTYLTKAGRVSAASHLEPLRSALKSYRGDAEALLRLAESHEQVIRDFWDRFDALDGRTKSALARAWRIFGHVIARNSLVDFNSSLDEIRRDYATRMASGDPAEASLEALTISATALSAAVHANDSALVRSQGEAWVEQLRADLERITALQQSLVQLDAQRREALEGFSRESLSVISQAGATKTSIVARGRPAAAAPGQPANTASPLLSFVPATTAASAAGDWNSGPGPTPAEDTSVSLGPSEYTAGMFWLSAAVLLLLLCVSVFTVASVVGPVRRMRIATKRLAAGEPHVQVARGGVRELDDLAVSFNQMAEQLAAARESARNYQEQLETKVNLRTRELRHLAEHDALTDLPNRRQLFTRLRAAIARAAESKSHVGVFFIDLDNFKNINDSMGHAFGDRVLGAVAERLRNATGPGGFAARLGGDEFTVICDSGSGEGAVRLAGWDLVRAFQVPLRVDERELIISISVGASLYRAWQQRRCAAARGRCRALSRQGARAQSTDRIQPGTARLRLDQVQYRAGSAPRAGTRGI